MVPTTTETETSCAARMTTGDQDGSRMATKVFSSRESPPIPSPRRDKIPAGVPRPLMQIAQRASDFAASLLALVLLGPLFLLVAILIRCDSPGPALFMQRRVGLRGKEFWLYKFRSMTADAESQRAQLDASNEQDGPLFKIRCDPRVTRVGRFLRKYSLDELPQLINVIKGEMSLVGPRPALPCEVDQYDDTQRRRLVVAPGLTGLWQVSGRADLPFDRSIELDLYYIAHQSVWLNLWIVLRTLPAVISARGAY